MEKCTFCNNFVEDDISLESDWRITMCKDSWDGHHYLNIGHEVWLGDFGAHECSTSVLINYCPICGRKLEDTENV